MLSIFFKCIFHLQTVRDLIVQNNFYVVKSKELKWTVADAQSFYSEHKGNFFNNVVPGEACLG